MFIHEGAQKLMPRYDSIWLFKSPLHCHICGQLIRQGEPIQSAKVYEIYTANQGNTGKMFKAQWHVECSMESYEQ